MITLIQIQDDLIEKLNQSAWRWNVPSHKGYRIKPGHYGRTRGGAVRRARAALAKLGVPTETHDQIIQDAIDVAELHLRAEG